VLYTGEVRIIRGLMDDPIAYLREHFKRNNSESGFSADKRSTEIRYSRGEENRLRHPDSARDCCTI
jgi:transposase